MRELVGNLFSCITADAICLLTNGVVTPYGANVMGKGCAGEAARKWPGIDRVVGGLIQQHPALANAARVITTADTRGVHLRTDQVEYQLPYHLVTFPTKDHWRNPSSLPLIYISAVQLANLADINHWETVVLPRPGCGAGGLHWEEVLPLLDPVLNDRFHAITFK